MLRRVLRVLTVSTMLTFSAPGQAQAAPVIGAVAAFAASPIGGIVLNLVGAVATSFAASLLDNMFGSKPAKPKPNLAMRLAVATGAIVAQSFLMGDWATAGSMNYRGSWGTAGGTPNAYYVEERVLSDLPMPQLTGFWYGPQKATILWNQPHAEMGWPVAEARRNGVDHMWVKYRPGTQTTADPYLRSRFGAHDQFPYTADMIGRGRAVAIVTRKVPDENNRDLFPANLEYKFETTGIALYDLSKDSTAGGFGSHRWNDPGTWEPSRNTAVQVYNLLRGVRWWSEWLFGLQDLHPARLPPAAWIAAINECRLSVLRADGSAEPQYCTGAEIEVSMEPAGVIDVLLAGASGRIAEIGGIYKPLFGAPGAAVMSFTDREIEVTKEQGYNPFPRIEQTHNGVRPKFTNPALGWQLDDAPARYSPEQEAEDGGQYMADVTLGAVTSVTQVQRLVKAAAEEQRRWRQHQLGFAPIYSELEPLDPVAWTSAENGYIDKKFLVTDIEDEPTYLQFASLKEWDPADYDYDAETEEKPSWVAPVGIVRPPPQVVAAWDVDGVAATDADGLPRRPGVLWTWDGTVEDVEAVDFEARIRTGAAAGTTVLTESTNRVDEGQIIHTSPRLLPGLLCEGRIKYRPRSARATEWTGWRPFDLPNTRLSLDDIDDLFREVIGLLPEGGTLSERFAELLAELDRVAAAATQVGVTGWTQLQQFSAIVDENTIYFVEQIAGVIDDTQAAVDLTTALLAEFGGSVSVAAERMSVTSNEFYAQAEYAQEVAAQFGGTTASAIRTSLVKAGPGGAYIQVSDILRMSESGTKYEMGRIMRLDTAGNRTIIDKASEWRLVDDAGATMVQPFYVSAGVVYIQDVRILGSLIVDETVTTNLMLANAVTGSVSFSQTSARASGDIIVEGLVTVVYGSVKLLFIGSQTRPWENPSNFGQYTLYLYRNGVAINSLPIFYDDNFSGTVSIAAVDTPGPGTFTYSVGSTVNSGMGGFTFAAGGRLIADNFKR